MRFFGYFTIFFLCALFVVPAKSAQLPLLHGPLVYSGDYERDGEEYRIFLYLGSQQNFLFIEIESIKNNIILKISGTWHQIRNGAFVQLSNNAFQRLLTVGGKGVLYLGVQVPDEKEGSKHVPVVLLPQNSALHAEGIRSIPAKDRESGYTPGYFLDAVSGSSWEVLRMGHDVVIGTSVVSFIPQKGAYSGKVEIFDGTRHVFGTFSLEGERLSLVLETTDKVFSSFAKQTQFWQLAGDVLELWNDKQIVALLERVR